MAHIHVKVLFITASWNVYFSRSGGIGWVNWDKQRLPNNLHLYGSVLDFMSQVLDRQLKFKITRNCVRCFASASLIVMFGLWNIFRVILYTLIPISVSVCSTQPQHGYTDFLQLANNNYIFLHFRIPRHFRINAIPLLRVAMNDKGCTFCVFIKYSIFWLSLYSGVKQQNVGFIKILDNAEYLLRPSDSVSGVIEENIWTLFRIFAEGGIFTQ